MKSSHLDAASKATLLTLDAKRQGSNIRSVPGPGA